MQVELIHYVPLNVADRAIAKCYNKQPYTEVEKQQGRIDRVANVKKHSSTIEHLVYIFDIDGISRAILQELARHRIASYTVKSTRYTLQELKKELPFIGYMCMDTDLTYDYERASQYVVLTKDIEVNEAIIFGLEQLRKLVCDGVANDVSKYVLPEAYKTSLVVTVNARSLKNFLELRSSKHALAEIQELAKSMYSVIPKDHKFMFDEFFVDKDLGAEE